MISIKDYVKDNGGLYIDLTPMYKMAHTYHNPGATDQYKLATTKRLVEMWANNDTLCAAASDCAGNISHPATVATVRDAFSFDEYGWDKHLNFEFPTAANQSDKYGYGADTLISASVINQFYKSRADMICIEMQEWQFVEENSICSIVAWLGQNVMRWDMACHGTHYTLIVTTPKAAVTFIENFINIKEAVDDLNQSTDGRIKDIPMDIIRKMFSYDGIRRFGLDMFNQMSAVTPDLDKDALPICFRADPLSVGASTVKDYLNIPTKTKQTPLTFAGNVFDMYGYVMDLSRVPRNARFPKLQKVIQRFACTGWCGTGEDHREAIETIIQHCMKYGNTITVKREVSGIELMDADVDPKEPDATEE